MHAKLIRIGNSRGVRLPKSVLEQAGLEGDLDIEVIDGAVVIRPAGKVREGWASAARDLSAGGEDEFSEWDSVTRDFDGEWE